MRRDDDWFGTREFAHRTSGGDSASASGGRWARGVQASPDSLPFFRTVEDEQPPESPGPTDLPLGAFGLTRGHEFIFRYGFGDAHRFQVTIADIHEHRSPRAKYPRVVARTGKAPEQYPRYD